MAKLSFKIHRKDDSVDHQILIVCRSGGDRVLMNLEKLRHDFLYHRVSDLLNL